MLLFAWFLGFWLQSQISTVQITNVLVVVILKICFEWMKYFKREVFQANSKLEICNPSWKQILRDLFCKKHSSNSVSMMHYYTFNTYDYSSSGQILWAAIFPNVFVAALGNPKLGFVLRGLIVSGLLVKKNGSKAIAITIRFGTTDTFKTLKWCDNRARCWIGDTNL